MMPIAAMILLFAACAPRPALLIVQIEPDPARPSASEVHIPSQAISLLKTFAAVNQHEVSVVLRPDITPAQIECIRMADRTSRIALNALRRQGEHVTQRALKEAEQAVSALQGALGASDHDPSRESVPCSNAIIHDHLSPQRDVSGQN